MKIVELVVDFYSKYSYNKVCSLVKNNEIPSAD